jgi:putative MATE family efflux protein
LSARDLTEGPVPRLIPALALPMMVMFALNSLYALADLFFVSRLGGAALAGMSIGLNTLLTVIAAGLCIGAGALSELSQAYGSGRRAEIPHLFQQAVWLTLAAGLGLWLVGWLNAGRYVRFFSEDAAVVAQGTAFFTAYSFSFFTQIALLVAGMCYRALGDFVLPTVVSSATVALNVGLDPLLIFGWGPLPALGIAGAGWATSLSQGAGVLAYLALTARGGRSRLLVLRGPWRLDPRLVGRLLRIGVPAGLRLLFLNVTLYAAFRFMRPLGGEVVAAQGLGMRIVQALIGLLGDSVGTAVASLVGQNYGARRWPRVKSAIRWGLGYYVAAFAAVYALILWNPSLWVAPFAKEEAIRHYAAQYLVLIGAALPFFGVSIITASAASGLGRSFPPLLASAVNLVCCLAGWTALQAWAALTYERLIVVAAASLYMETAVMAVVLGAMWRRFGDERGALPQA